MSNPVIRNYKPEDLPQVMKLYNSCQVEAPFFLRDESYFNYFTCYPGVKEDSIFVAVNEHEIKGLVIIAITQKGYTTGKLIEFWASEVIAAKALLQRAVEYCRDNNIDAVVVSPPTFLDLDKTFADWQRIDQRGVLMAKPLSLVPLIRALFKTAPLTETKTGNTFLFITDNETIKVKINETEVNIVEGEKSRQNPNIILVRIDSKALLEVIFGSTNPYIALLTGRIKIRGIKNIFQVTRMLRATRINRPWTVAIVDRR